MGAFKDFWLGTEQPVQKQEIRVDEEGNPSPLILPPSRTSIINVQPKEAIRIATVYRSIDIIATMVSQMDLRVFRGEELMKSTPLIVRNPIESESQSSFVIQCIHSLALWGNCYWKTYGTPVSSIDVLDPDTVVVSRDELSGKVQYWVNGKLVPNDRIKHLKFETMPGALLGHGPLSAATGAVRAALMFEKFQEKWFDTTGIPVGVITVPGAMNPQQSKMFSEAWDNFIKDTSRTPVLPGGIKYDQIQGKPAEMQYLEVSEANTRNIARIFGIPAANLLSAIDGTSMTYTNYIESNLQFLQNTLLRYMNEIEDGLSSLLPRSQKVLFNQEQLLRMAPEKFWTVKKLQTEVGYTSGDELRAEEGKEPLPKPVVSPTTLNKDNSVKDDTLNDGN